MAVPLRVLVLAQIKREALAYLGATGKLVETAGERAALTDLGCDLLQGFWVGRPQGLQ